MPALTAPEQRSPLAVRFWSKVDKTGPCWIWTAGKAVGYGYFWLDGQMRPAHRVAWQLTYGAIPEGMELDHLKDVCGNTACVKVVADESGPAHLQAVTHQVNVLRGDSPHAHNFRKSECVNGHEFTPGNTVLRKRGEQIRRECRICTRRGNAIRVARWRAARRASAR